MHLQMIVRDDAGLVNQWLSIFIQQITISPALSSYLGSQYRIWFPSFWLCLKSNERVIEYFQDFQWHLTAPLGLLCQISLWCCLQASQLGRTVGRPLFWKLALCLLASVGFIFWESLGWPLPVTQKRVFLWWFILGGWWLLEIALSVLLWKKSLKLYRLVNAQNCVYYVTFL